MLVRRLAPQEDNWNIAEVPTPIWIPSRATWCAHRRRPSPRSYDAAGARVEQSRSAALLNRTLTWWACTGDLHRVFVAVQGEK